MSSVTHGLSISIESVGSDIFLSLKAQGKLTHHDYETIIQMIDSALAAVTEPKVKMLFDGSELDGWELRAVWDDFKLRLKHGKEFVKVAIYGNKRWDQMAAKVGNWFTSGEVHFFDDYGQAISWLKSA
jgi:hypothetical protein